MRAIELIAQLSLVAQAPGLVPIYTEDGIFVENPAIGYPDSMLASTCSEEDAGLAKTACLWAHEDIGSSMAALDVE